MEKQVCEQPTTPKEQVPPSTRVVQPIFDRKTGALFFPAEKRYLKVLKDKEELTVEYMHSLARDRMQIKVDNISLWQIGDSFQIKGKGLTYICIVKSIRKRKVVIQKTDQILEKPEDEEIVQKEVKL